MQTMTTRCCPHQLRLNRVSESKIQRNFLYNFCFPSNQINASEIALLKSQKRSEEDCAGGDYMEQIKFDLLTQYAQLD